MKIIFQIFFNVGYLILGILRVFINISILCLHLLFVHILLNKYEVNVYLSLLVLVVNLWFTLPITSIIRTITLVILLEYFLILTKIFCFDQITRAHFFNKYFRKYGQ